MSGPPTQTSTLGDGRNIRRDVSRRSVARASSSRPDDSKPATTHATPNPPPRHRAVEDERARAAAKQAEKEMWEKTRGAGSSVFKLADSGRIRRGTETDEWKAEDVLPSLEEVENKLYEIVEVPSIDVLLSRGICDYTLLPKTLGRGKFSTVFMASKNGELSAIKHTALFPHHQLISTRLLREPTLLAELPPHPNLVAVKETIRTPGHFYLVEEYLGGYVTLEALLPMLSESQPAVLPTEAAEKILSQLLSAVHSIHVPLQICHRDIKPENILVHPETLQLKLLDFGLATHYSKSEPKLSTCCGSPAFHCPEIVKALASPPGTVMYMGPEVDAWTCGVTMLRCLTGQRFPLGASHSSMRGMAIRAQRAVASIADEGLRSKVGALLEMEGTKRMKRFSELVAEQEKFMGGPIREGKKFKSTTFIPVEPTHSIKLPLLAPHLTLDAATLATPGYTSPTTTAVASRRTTPANSRPPSPSRSRSMTPVPHSRNHIANIVAMNPTYQPPERVLSYIKYCLRCAGILYHSWPDSSAAHKQRSVSPVNYFNSHASPLPQSSTTEASNAGFAEAIGLHSEHGTAHQPGLSPVTPLFPSFHLQDEKSEGFAHVQVFQCVAQVLDEEDDKNQGAEQMSLVQSIMAAFGRRKPPASSPTATPRPDNKRSLSTPAKARIGSPSTTTASTSGRSASKDGAVRCLTFHLIVRFPKVPIHTTATNKLGPRSASSMSLSQQVASNSFAAHGRHTRALSGGTTLPLREASLLVEGIKETVKAQNPESEAATLTINTDAILSSHSTPQPSPRLVTNRSPSSSRAPSRTRKRSHRGPQKKPKVFIQVTDSRALQAVRDALSVGGTIDSLEDDYFSSNHHHRQMLPSSTTGDLGALATPLAETSEPLTPSRGDQKRKVRSRTSTSIGAVPRSNDSTNSTPRASEEITSETIRSTDHEHEERRGRQLTNGLSRNAGVRAPSQLSKVALMEEPLNDEDFKHSISALTTVLQTIMSSPTAGTPEVTVASPGTPSSGQGSDNAASSANSSNLSSIPAMTAFTGRDTRVQMQARTLLMDISQRLHQAEKSGPNALEDLISAMSFSLFSALTPALGLEPQETRGLPTTGGTSEGGEATTLRGLALSSLSIIARSASPREMFLAVQERLEIISATRTTKDSSTVQDKGLLQVSSMADALPPSAPIASETWSGALEVSGLMHFLSIVVPRIKTEKPSNFLQPLMTAIPRSVRSSLRVQPIFDAREGGLSDLGSQSNNGSNPQTPSTEGNKEMVGGDGQTTSDRIKVAASEVTIALAKLTHSLASWVNSFEQRDAEKTRPLLYTLFLASVIALMPELPKVEGYSTLAELHFQRWYPHYSFDRPSQSSQLVKTSTDLLQPKVWHSLQSSVDMLRLDLEQCAFQWSNSESLATQDSNAIAIMTMGAFILDVNLLSRSFDQEKMAPMQWSPDESLRKLKKAMPILLASLGSNVPATISVDGTQSLGGTAHLSDAALSWVLWCIQGLNQSKETIKVEETDLIPIFQMLSSHAALCPDPPSRLISLSILEIILDKNTTPNLGREILRDLILESPFPHLKSASIGLTKRLIASDLNQGLCRYASREMLESISAFLFTLPSHAPEQPQLDINSSKTYLDDNSAWLSECLGLIYLVAARDKNNQTGLMDEKSLLFIRTSLLEPLERLILPLTASPSSTKEETEVALQCSLLSVALDRAKEVLEIVSS